MNESVRQIRVRYEGDVQGIGFRYTARGIANRLGLNGGVENMNDGSVQLVAEGPEGNLNRLLTLVRQSRVGPHIANEQIAWGEPRGLVGFYYR